LSISRPTNAAGMPTQRLDSGISQEDFYAFLDREMKKIEQFTKHQVSIRSLYCTPLLRNRHRLALTFCIL
jgi:hypothetical protein